MNCPYCRGLLEQRSPDRRDELVCVTCGTVWVAGVSPPDPAEDGDSFEASMPASMASETRGPTPLRLERHPCPCEDAWPHPSTFLG